MLSIVVRKESHLTPGQNGEWNNWLSSSLQERGFVAFVDSC